MTKLLVMKKCIYRFLTCSSVLFLSAVTLFAQADLLSDVKKLELVGVSAEKVKYRGKDGVRVVQRGPAIRETMAILQGIDFRNGTIEVELSGKPLPGSDTTVARGFVGLAFRVLKKDTLQFECFYLRPTNGRSSDQLRRNHVTQYVSEPQFPWHRLRKEKPGVYESYVDLEAGAWTKVKIVVKDRRARLYVHDSQQPSLVVNDILHAVETGQLALWIGASTEGHFRNLRVTTDR